MSHLWKYTLLSMILTAGMSTTLLAEEIKFSEIELVEIGKSDSFHSIGSLSDGTAIVLTSPASGSRIQGFAISKIVEKQSVALAYFEAKPLSIKAKYFDIREATIQVDRDDNIITLYNVRTLGNDNSSNTGTELQISAFDSTGKLKYSKLINQTGPDSNIDGMNASILPSGNFLSVYNFSNRTTTDVFMTEFTPVGDVIASRQVSDARDKQGTGDGRLTSDALKGGHNLAIGPSGQFRIIWSHGRRSSGGVLFASTAVATYGKSGKRKTVDYIDEKPNSTVSSLSTFYRKGGEFSDVIVTFLVELGRFKIKFYQELASGERELVRERRTGAQPILTYGVLQFREHYALYTSQNFSFNCYLYYANLSDGGTVRAIWLNNGRLANKCNGGTSIKMADRSIGSLISISGDTDVVSYFVRHKASKSLSF